MRTLHAILAVLLASIGAAVAGPAAGRIIVLDNAKPDNVWSTTVTRGESIYIRTDLYNRGAVYTNNDLSGYIWYASNNTAQAGVMIRSTSSEVGRVWFQLSATDTLGLSANDRFPTSYFAQVVLTNATRTYDWQQGRMTCRNGSGISATGSAAITTLNNGGSLTNLNASELRSGTVPLARLSGITSNQMDAATDAAYRLCVGGGADSATTNFIMAGDLASTNYTDSRVAAATQTIAGASVSGTVSDASQLGGIDAASYLTNSYANPTFTPDGDNRTLTFGEPGSTSYWRKATGFDWFVPATRWEFRDNTTQAVIASSRYGYLTNGITAFSFYDTFRVWKDVSSLGVYDTLTNHEDRLTGVVTNGQKIAAATNADYAVSAGTAANATNLNGLSASTYVTNNHLSPSFKGTMNIVSMEASGTITVGGSRRYGQREILDSDTDAYFGIGHGIYIGRSLARLWYYNASTVSIWCADAEVACARSNSWVVSGNQTNLGSLTVHGGGNVVTNGQKIAAATNADYAVSAGTAATATNALQLGGIAAASYVTNRATNIVLTGTLTPTNSLTVTNALQLGGIAAASYITNNAGGKTFSGTTTFTNLNVTGVQTNYRTLTVHGGGNVVTNGGATVNGQAVSNGAAITVTGGSSLTLPTTLTAPTSSPVFVVFGQSNELGNNQDLITVFGDYTSQVSQCTYTLFEDHYGGLSITNGILTMPATNRFGSEMIFGHLLTNYYSSFGIVKQTKDGASITNWNVGNFHWTRLTNAISTTMTNMTARGLNPQVRWISIMQGEQDATTNAAGDWATNAYNVMTALTNWIGGNPHIAICRISNGTGLTSRAYYSNVRTAQYTASTNLSNASMISTDGFYTWDGTHFSGSGLIDLGNARLQNILNNAADLRVIGTLSAKSFVGDIGNTTVAGTNFQQYVVGLTEASTNLAGFFSVYLTTNHAVANASATAIAFDAELDDLAGVHNAGAFTFPKGYVDAVIGYGWASDTAGAYRMVRRYKNGSLVLPDLHRGIMAANAATANHTIGWRFYNDNATNVYRLYVYSDDPTAANRAVASNSYVTGWTIQR